MVEELRELRYLEVRGMEGRDYLLAPTDAGSIVALQRDCEVGTGTLEIAEQFQPFVSVREEAARQLASLEQWLDASPFDEALRGRLITERHGLAYCATRIEEVCRQPRRERRSRATPPWIRHAAGTLFVRFGQWLRG